MQTASGGPIRLRFTPEQIAEFERQAARVPGMNNSGMSTYRTQGEQAQQHQEQEKQRKDKEIKSRMEMRPTLKRKATISEKLRGKGDEYEQTPQVVGMSGADPLLSFYVGGVGLNGIGALAKTGLWNVAKYAPTTQLGNWGRGYFVGNVFKNSFNGTVPSFTLQPYIRTKIGDVEINNPQLAYRQGSREMGENFSKTGIVSTDGEGFTNPMFAQGRLWYGIPTNKMLKQGKGIQIKTSSGRTFNLTKRNEEAPKTDLLVSNAEMSPASSHSTPQKWITTIDGKTSVQNWGDRRVPTTQATQENTVRYIFKPGYGYQKVIQEPSTSLKFFERKPSKISEAEKFGLNKHDRKALSINEQQALEDLAQYKNSGQYRQIFRVTPDWENFGWNLDRGNPSFLQQFVKDGETMRGPWARVVLQTPTGKGVLAVNPEKNMVGYTSRSFPVPEGMNWAPGEANMMIDGTNGQKIILTAPRTDFFDAIVEKGSESIGERLPNIIDKNIMKDFWINSRKAQRPGTYLSGDNGHAPKGSELIEAFKKRQLYKVDIKERPLNKQFVTRTGLSPDSYSSIIRQGNRDGSLRWGEGFNKWNNSAVENRFINEAFQKLQKGEITPEQYEEIFNNWSLNIGGRKLQWKDFNGHKIPIHPHPYIYAKKQGGKMNILEFLKNGSGIHIKEKNKGKFTSYCGGKVTDECIQKGKNSSNPAIRKRATFAANARKWKHQDGGIIIAEKGIKAGQKAKQNLTKRKAPDWDNLDRGYRYLTQDMKLPHDQAIAIMGNVVEESQGNYKAAQKNGGGRGLIQWDGQPTPTGRYGQWGKIWASVAKPANVYDSKTDTMKNYWAPWGGLKGEQVRQKFINAPLKTKTKIYAESYLRPGNPRIKDRQLSAMQLDSIYNPRIKNIIIDKEGGIIKAEDGTKFNWQSALTNMGTNLFSSYLQSRIQNNKINSETEATKAENELDLDQYFLDIYQKELAKAQQEEEQKNKAISAMNDTVINSSPLVTQKKAYDRASQNYGNQKANQDARNKAIDAQAEAAKSSAITDAVSGVIQNGLGMLKDYYGSKNNNASITNTSNSYFDNSKYKKFGTFNPDGSMNMLGGTFTINGGYKPNQPQLFNYQPLKLNV